MTKNLPNPRECGLPEKYAAWRPSQEHALHVTVTAKKRFTALCLPTGSGKTGVYMADTLLSGEPTCIVTESRGLQDQIMDDFGSVGMVDLRGRANYECNLKPDYTCEDGAAARCPFNGSISCPASQAEIRASLSPLVVTNYSKWVAAALYGTGMNHFKRVVFDEGHSCFEALAKAMQVVFNHREIEEDLKLSFLPYPAASDIKEWKEWAISARAISELKQLEAGERLRSCKDPKTSWIRHYTHMRNLTRRLGTVALASSREWVVEEVDAGFQFDPIRPGKYSEYKMFFKIPRIIIVSATLRPKSMAMIGVPKDQYEFHEFPSDFDPKRCPIYYVPKMRVDRHAKDLGPLWNLHDQIAGRRRHLKGIDHTISFDRQKQLLAASQFSHAMITNDKGDAPTEKIDEFRAAPPGAILVSPSVGTGYDFPGSDCGWQFLCKIPFDPPSVILKAREENDSEYSGHRAMQKMVQIFGRGMRSRTDQCESFIGDMHLDWFMPRFGHHAPKSFHSFFNRAATVPPPLPR